MPIALDTALVGLGANLGDGAATISAALEALQALPECTLLRASGLYRSTPVDAHGPDYWNAVAALQCGLSPLQLLAHLQNIERAFGRVRPEGVHNAPRTLDLDLLLFGANQVRTPHLTLPHPRMHLRAFVLAPLAEIWPDWALPGGEPVRQAAQRLQDEGQVLRRTGPLGNAPR